MSDSASNAAKRPPISRRAMLAGGGGAVIVVGATAAAIARGGPKRADGLPAIADLHAARELGDGFFLVDGWVLTAEDVEALRSASGAGRH